MKIEHKLSPAWAKHVQEVHEQIRHTDQQNWILRGQIAHNENELQMMRKHLNTTLGVIVDAEKLPKSSKPYSLSADGSALIGEAEVSSELAD